MNKITIRSCLFVLIAGMFLVVSGCGYRCERWATRIAYRQVCRGYSSDGNCSLWGTESYQDTYCTKWVEIPGSKKNQDPRAHHLSWFSMQGDRTFLRKKVHQPLEKPTWLHSLHLFSVKSWKVTTLLKLYLPWGNAILKIKPQSAGTSNTNILQKTIRDPTISLWMILPLNGCMLNEQTGNPRPFLKKSWLVVL